MINKSKIKKIYPWNKGMKMSLEHKKKILDTHWSKRTETRKEVIKKISKANKGKKHTEKTKRKISIGNKGQIVSEENKKMIRKKLLGIPLSEERKEKISKANKGNHNSKKTEFKKGMEPWNKGTIGVMKSWNKGMKMDKNKYPNFGIRGIRDKIKLPFKDTSIEKKIQDFLTLLKIEFITHKHMNIKNSYQCDIFIPKQIQIYSDGTILEINKKTIIECDGDYFHMNPNKFLPEDTIFKNGMKAKQRWKLDKVRTEELTKNGFNVLRLWENKIRAMTIEDFRNELFIKGTDESNICEVYCYGGCFG